MAKPVCAKEDADKDSHASYLKLGLMLNAAEAILSSETEATFGVFVIAVSHKLWQANKTTTYFKHVRTGDTILVIYHDLSKSALNILESAST